MSQRHAPCEPFSQYRSIIDDWAAFQQAIARPLPTCVWTNTLRTTPEEVERRLREEQASLEPLAWYPGAFRLAEGVKAGRLWPVLSGLCQIQEEVALLPVALLDPKPHHRVLDLCAAPGNKLAQIAVLMRNQGTVLGNDLYYDRMRAVRYAVEKLGLVNVSTSVQDGTSFPPSAGLFDRILVDAPCSCEGTCRKNPKVIDELMRGGYRKKVAIQKALLKKAVKLCRPGGRIVYSTCTFAPEENEQVVDQLLREFGSSGLRLLPVQVPGLSCSEGLTRWREEEFDSSLSAALRIWPHQNDTGGFFVAVLELDASAIKKRRAACERESEAAAAKEPADASSDDAREIGDTEREALRYARDRFGLPAGCLEKRGVLTKFTRFIYLQARDHRPPRWKRLDASGLRLLRTDMRYPKLTTAGAMLLGAEATRNVADVDRSQLRAYIARQAVPIRPEQIVESTGTGYVMVRHGGAVLGLGLCRFEGEGRDVLLESYFPKGWSKSLFQ